MERVDLPSGEHAYVECEPIHHHHVICSLCQRTTEIEACGMPAVTRDVARRTGFRIQFHRLELFGVCPDCQAANRRHLTSRRLDDDPQGSRTEPCRAPSPAPGGQVGPGRHELSPWLGFPREALGHKAFELEGLARPARRPEAPAVGITNRSGDRRRGDRHLDPDLHPQQQAESEPDRAGRAGQPGAGLDRPDRDDPRDERRAGQDGYLGGLPVPVLRHLDAPWEPNLIRDFVAPGTMTYTFNNFAFLGEGHDPNESLDAAVAAWGAEDQGKFWEYHDWLYANQNPNGENRGWFTRSNPRRHRREGRLDQAMFDTCLADPAKATAVQAERTAGEALGVGGTPMIFVNGKVVTLSTYDDLAKLIRSLARPLRRRPAPRRAASPRPAAPTARPLRRDRRRSGPIASGLALAGLLIAGYLSLVRLPAACPCTGRSRAARRSPAARTARSSGRVAFLASSSRSSLSAWRRLGARRGSRALLALYALGLLGVLFVAYLTYLELFVIDAVCVWCASYAITIVAGWLVAAVTCPPLARSG